MPRVLIVDDEEPVRSSLAHALAREGYSVSTAADGPTALERAGQERPDVVLLDLTLPGLDGMEVCRGLRKGSDVGIVMVTGRDRGHEKVAGLASGADDYVTKPYELPELLARVGAVLRRRLAAQRLLHEDRALVGRLEELVARSSVDPIATTRVTTTPPRVQIGRLFLDAEGAATSIGGTPARVTSAERELLAILLEYDGRVVTRTELIERVWGAVSPDTLTLLAAHIRLMREKIEEDPANPRVLVAVPGIGFQLLLRPAPG